MKALEVLFVFIVLFFLACGGPSVTNVANNEKGALFPVSVDNSWGFIDKQGDLVINNEVSSVELLMEQRIKQMMRQFLIANKSGA